MGQPRQCLGGVRARCGLHFGLDVFNHDCAARVDFAVLELVGLCRCVLDHYCKAGKEISRHAICCYDG